VRRAVADDVAEGGLLKRRALRGTLDFLDRRLDDALAPLWSDLALGQRWQEQVDRLSRERFFERYRREYLDGEKYVDFNQTMLKLMDRLEMPGIGPIITGVSQGLKTVSKFVFGSVAKGVRWIFTRGEPRLPRTGPELEIVAEAFDDWITALRGEAQTLAQNDPHPAWRGIAGSLDRLQASPAYIEGLAGAYQEYRDSMDRITNQRAQALYEQIATRPALLNTLRGLKVTLDVGTTALIVSSKGINWTDAVIGPLVAPVQRLILEFGLDQFMTIQKAQLKQDQLGALRGVIERRMMDPVRALYRPAAVAAELTGARTDLETIMSALTGILDTRSEPRR
jgi:hypothetical protein